MDQNGLITQRLKDVLKRELDPQKLETLERVDLICAYIKTTGLEQLAPFFQHIAEHEPPVPVRIFTTSQLSISDPGAIYQLALLPNVEIKVFKASNPTFHAKGWLFVHGGKTPDVAIVGSSNMSSSAIETGLEWNIYTTAEPVIIEFKKVFESYWSGKHPAFGESSVLKYDLKTCDWESLCKLFPSEVEPRCNDSTGNCGHPECRKLSQEFYRLEKRKAQILDSFKNGRSERSRKRSQPPINPWNLPQGAPSTNRLELIDDVRENSLHPSQDLMEIDGDSQMYSTSNSLAPDLYTAVFGGEKSAVEMMIQKAKQLPSGDELLPYVPDFILDEARNRKGTTPLHDYDLHIPLLFAIAFSDDAIIVRIIFQAVSEVGPFRSNSQPDVTESIFHVLARLNPQKACEIFKEVRTLHRYTLLQINDYNSPNTAIAIAKETSKEFTPQDRSFVRALDGFFDSRKPGSGLDPKLRGKIRKLQKTPRKKSYQAPKKYPIAWKDTFSHGVGRR